MHHILQLEHVFGQIKNSLKAQGCFVISDMIGRNGHQRWPEALNIVRQYWRKLPPSYRFNHSLQRYEEVYQDWDYSEGSFEGIRSQDILKLLLDRFHFHLFVGFGNVIDPFVDPAFGFNFDATSLWDRSFIDDVHQRDEEEMISGHIKPTHMLAVVASKAGMPLMYHEPLRPEFCLRNTTLVAPRAQASRTSEASEGAYEWHSWPHSPQSELEIACRRLGEYDERIRGGASLIEERTAWALRLDHELEEQTAWALHLNQELKERTAQVIQLSQDLEELAWARALRRRIPRLLAVALSIVWWVRHQAKQPFSQRQR